MARIIGCKSWSLRLRCKEATRGASTTYSASQISMRLNKLDYNKVQTFNSLMNKLVPPLVCAAAALALTTFASSSADRRSANHGSLYVAYQQEDADSNVETESDSEGTYDVFYDRLAPDGRWFY